MGKQKSNKELEEEVNNSRPTHKKKHKHKHKKHKRKKEHGSMEESSESKGREVKLKIKLGGQTLATTHAQVREFMVSEEEEDIEVYSANSERHEDEHYASADEKSQEVNVENGDSEDEWLAALESGDLDENGRVRTSRKKSMMTARQRAMMGEVEYVEPLLELPMGRKQSKEVTEEMLQRKQQRATKRKLQIAKKIEQNKAQTIDKLLYKQASRSRKDAAKKSMGSKDIPRIRYTNRVNFFSLSFPENIEFPMIAQTIKIPKERELCAVDGCKNFRRYADSKLNLPLCSFECYKKLNNSKIEEMKVAN
ncbi:INO80 complex subunit B [Trichoplax sp. H2]|nr:INO80 complex subunit B [Trichoplax sp. H2]|eukprot:RDD41114.1 INO80 complex subunit B [Trichoplax sp. H2]